jgi:hypothetical protein
MRRRGRRDDRQRDVAEQLILGVQPVESDCDTLLPGGIRAPCCPPSSIRLVGQLLPARGPVVRAVGRRDMCAEFGACAHQLHATPEEGTGRAQPSRLDGGVREQPATEEDRAVLRVALRGFRLAAVDGFHIQGLPQDEGHTLPSTPVSQPGPT